MQECYGREAVWAWDFIGFQVHRRSFTDDGMGMTEPLDDVGPDDKGIMYTGKWLLVAFNCCHLRV